MYLFLRFKPSRVSELTLDEVEDEEKVEDDSVQRQMFKPSRVSEVVLAENYEEDPGVDRLVNWLRVHPVGGL